MKRNENAEALDFTSPLPKHKMSTRMLQSDISKWIEKRASKEMKAIANNLSKVEKEEYVINIIRSK